MKKIISLLSLVVVLLSCNSAGQNNVAVVPNTNNDIQVQAENVPGFNVPAFANLVKTTANPQMLEQQINDPNTGINTLDLDSDGNVDYLKVVEKANQLMVVDETPTNQITIATLNITPNGDVSVMGNQMYSGANYNYHNRYSLTDAILLSYLLRPHPYYIPSYHYGFYPSSYRRTSVVNTRTRIISRNTANYNRNNYNRNTYNRAAKAAPYRKSLTNPTTSQRSFSTGSNRPLNTSGFGKTVSPSKPSSSFFSRPSSSGFGKSSSSGFGKSSRPSSFKRR